MNSRLRLRSRGGLVAVLVLLCLGAAAPVSPLSSSPVGAAYDDPGSARSADDLPPESRWRADVRRVMDGSGRYLIRRAARPAPPGRQLAINLDVDNTMLATTYDRGTVVGPVLRFTRRAEALGVAVLVNTARTDRLRKQTLRALRKAGYRPDRLCLRPDGRGALGSKRACRRGFAEEGFTIVANVGNRATDFRGTGYGRSFRLPDYDGALG